MTRIIQAIMGANRALYECMVCGQSYADEGTAEACENGHSAYSTTRSTLGASPTDDMVASPPHYTAGGVECIDAIEAALTPVEFRGYCKGNAMKYVWRERHKGGSESVSKAAWYLARLLGT